MRELNEANRRGEYALGAERDTRDARGKANACLAKSAKPRILIVSQDDAVAEVLEVILLYSGLSSVRARSMAAGCEFARSGQFPVVMTNPVLTDGTWRHLTDLASRYRPGFVSSLLPSGSSLKSVPTPLVKERSRL